LVTNPQRPDTPVLDRVAAHVREINAMPSRGSAEITR